MTTPDQHIANSDAAPIGDELTMAAINALRSYEYGNASPDLAKSVADKLSEARRATPALAKQSAAPIADAGARQLADWLLTDPQTGEKLHFAGPLERDFLGLSRVKMESKTGEVWTLTAGLKEGYLTADERAANLRKVADEEREAVREPSLDQLKEMAYLLELVPRGEVVCAQFLLVLRKQYRAAMEASGC